MIGFSGTVERWNFENRVTQRYEILWIHNIDAIYNHSGKLFALIIIALVSLLKLTALALTVNF